MAAGNSHKQPGGDNSSPKQLQSLSYTCPGLQGPGSQQDIVPCPIADLWAAGAPVLVVPLFQRRYAWADGILWRWYADVVDTPRVPNRTGLILSAADHAHVSARSKSTTLGVDRHRVGKVVLKTLPDGSIFVIDGQQRVTTSLLLIAALRDCALRIAAEAADQTNQQEAERVAQVCNGALFRDLSDALRFVRTRAAAGLPVLEDPLGLLPHTTLAPSHADRHAYFELICHGLLGKPAVSELTRSSLQFAAFSLFSEQLPASIAQRGLRWVAQRVLDGQSIMRVSILNPINYGQVFLWLQEGELFSAGAQLLHNPAPGRKFMPGDLVRNVLLSPFMDRPASELEALVRERWVEAIELPCGSPDRIVALLRLFVESQLPVPPGSFAQKLAAMGAGAQQMLRQQGSSPIPNPKAQEFAAAFSKRNPTISLYRDFLSVYEHMHGRDPSDERLEQTALAILSSLRDLTANLGPA